MSRAYEVNGCKECPHLQTTLNYYTETTYHCLLGSSVALDFASVFINSGIPEKCLLPEYPHPTPSAKGGDV